MSMDRQPSGAESEEIKGGNSTSLVVNLSLQPSATMLPASLNSSLPGLDRICSIYKQASEAQRFALQEITERYAS